jgi:hypothetical protein
MFQTKMSTWRSSRLFRIVAAMDHTEIIEIVRRSEQGATRPFICIGENGARYFVKGINANRDGQINEWICANLAEYFELPVARYQIVDVPEELIFVHPSGIDLSDLGVGPAFASEAVPLDEINYSSIDLVEEEIQQDVVIFDWWIKNGDRCLSEVGGNPNLFWNPDEQELVVIDHNLAFDPDVSQDELARSHIFNREISASLSTDFFRRGEFEQRMAAALDHWDDILAMIPDEWNYKDSEMTIDTDYDYEGVRTTLDQYLQEGFWEWE